MRKATNWNNEKLKKKFLIVFCGLLFVLAVAGGVTTGAVSIGRQEALAIIWQEALALIFKLLPGAYSPAEEIVGVHREIIMQMRLPRVLLAASVGASLAVAGATFQGLFRNPMADPYVIGVSSGAALGAVFAMIIPTGFALAGFGAVPLFAFAGGLITIMLVYYMARVGSVVPVMTLLLAGIAISAFLSALVSLLTYFAGEQLHQVVFWMMGGFSGASWLKVKVMIPYALAGYLFIQLLARELNAMLLGEETARHLGVETEKVKKLLLVGASLLVAAAVATSGVIGFIGLIVPHFIRLVAGPDHRFLLPASALLGAGLLICTDTLARTVIAPTELPVGIITAMIGAPLFIYLLKKRKKLRYFYSSE